MTVAVLVKVFDGLVLAADSATTMELTNGSHQVWNNANKVFHLHRRKPVGAMTWGTGNLGPGSIEVYAKDFRRRLMGRDPDHQEATLPADYTIEGVAHSFANMIYDEVYLNTPIGKPDQLSPALLVAGYDAGSKNSEAWLIPAADRKTRPNVQRVVGHDQAGYLAFGQDEATHRLFYGWAPELPEMIKNEVSKASWTKVEKIFSTGAVMRQPATAPMPFADAIALARYLVDVTVGYSRYLLGPDIVGGPVEVAGITRHEGFRWVTRKHYYPQALNPEDPGHDY